MARNGSGIFELSLPPVEPDTVISSTWANQTLDDIANGLSESLPVSGERGMTGPFKLADGSASNPAFSFNSESATGLFRPSTNVIAFSVGGGERMRISGGNLLLGRTTDDGTNVLQVGGQAKIFGGFIVDGGLNVGTGATISGDTTLGNVGFVNGSGATLNLTNRLDVFGDGITTNGIHCSGDQTITGTLGVGNVLALGVAAADGEFTTLEVNTFQVNGTSALSNVNVSGNLTVVGTATLPILNSTTITATTVNGSTINQTSTTGTGEINLGVGRTADGGSVLNFRTAAGNSTYNFRINRAGGVNGIAYFQQLGGGRMAFENDTNSEFRFSTFATGGATQKFTAPNLTQGADFSVHGVSLSSVGNVNFFFQNGSQTTTQNYYSVSRNATAGIGTHVFRTGGDASVSGSATTALTISETAVLPALQVQNIVGTEAAPSYAFSGDSDTGIYRSSSNNLDFSTGGVRRLQIDSAGRLYQYSTGGELLNMKTTGNNGLFNLDVSTGTPNINNLSWYLTSAGTAMLILRNDAKTGYVAPIQVSRNAASGTASIVMKVGGNSNTTGSDTTALTISETGATFSVPVIAPQSVSSTFSQGQIYSTASGFTLNTGMGIGTYTIYNNSAASITATQGSGLTLRLSGTATTGNRTIAQRGIATLTVLSSTEYILSGAVS